MKRLTDLWGYGFLVLLFLFLIGCLGYIVLSVFSHWLGMREAILFLLAFVGVPLFVGWIVEDYL